MTSLKRLAQALMLVALGAALMTAWTQLNRDSGRQSPKNGSPARQASRPLPPAPAPVVTAEALPAMPESRPLETAGAGAVALPSAAQLAALYLAKPEMRDKMNSFKRQVLEQRYAGLLAQWELAPEERQEVMDLLLESDQAKTDQGMRIVAAVPGERPRLVEEWEDRQREIDGRLQATLGSERYTQYSDYTETLPARVQVEKLSQTLAHTEEPLTTEQSASLLQILSASRVANAGKPPPPGFEGNQTGVLDPASAQVVLRNVEDENDAVASQAGPVLSPSQLEAFRKIQSQRVNNAKRGLDSLL